MYAIAVEPRPVGDVEEVKESGGEPVCEEGEDHGEERVGETGDEGTGLEGIKRVGMEYGMIIRDSSVDSRCG